MGDRAAARKRLLEKLHFDPCADWRVVLDRVRFGCDRDPRPGLVGVPGFIPGPTKPLKNFPQRRFRPYAQLQYWRDERSEMTLLVELERTKHWLPHPFRITFNADDGTGIPLRRLLDVLEVVTVSGLVMIEVAFDYAGELTHTEIRRRVLFGKARPARSTPDVAYWGHRYNKLAKIYFKPHIGCSRFELELGTRFLQQHQIADVFDFSKLAQILPSHISFLTLNEQKLTERLNAMSVSAKRKRAINRFIEKSGGDLWPILQLLRSKEIGMTNTRRLLEERAINEGAMNALKAWAEQWPTQRMRRTKSDKNTAGSKDDAA
jgi:hypothetical protein